MTINRWEQPFRTEDEIVDQFNENVDKLISYTQEIANPSAKQIGSLEFSKKQFSSWIGSSTLSNIFLVPAIRSALDIAKTLEQSARYESSFWTCNVFGEMCKLLVARNREKYQGLFEEYLLTSCYAFTGAYLEHEEYMDIHSAEIEDLRIKLEIICRQALSTYYHRKSNTFRRTNKRQDILESRTINDALARHFDKRIRYLIQHDRPRVKEFVTTNMPLVYQLELSEHWAKIRDDWKELITDSGYEDVIQFLEDMGDLVSLDEIGQVNAERRDDIRRAQLNNDFKRVGELLTESANEIKSFLYKEAQQRLDFRPPPWPNPSEKHLRYKFGKAKRFAQTNDPDNLRKALDIAQSVWQQDINNLGLRDWVAYLQAKTGNLPAAEQMLLQVRKRRSAKHNFFTDWNLAVLAYDRKDEAQAYQLLAPLLDFGRVDDDLIIVILALSLKLDDKEMFLSILPNTMSLQFHPLAFVIAHEIGDKSVQDKILRQLLGHWQGKWELPPVTTHFSSQEDLEKTVNRAIVEGQIDQLISWLQARITTNKNWVPNYLVLARVLEVERQDIDSAFQTLQDRYYLQTKSKPRNQPRIDEACQDLLDLCKRANRKDLGQRAYKLATKAKTREDLLNSYEHFAPGDKIIPPPDPPKPTPAPSIVQSSSFPEQLAWSFASFASIRNISSYVKELEKINEYCEILSEMYSQESSTVVELIQNSSVVIDTFSKTDPEDIDTRRTLHERGVNYENRLSHLLESNALTKQFAGAVNPYHEALKRVIGDLSRKSGIGPTIDVAIENPFISLDNGNTSLIIRVTNPTERTVQDILIDLLLDSTIFSINGGRDQKIIKLEPGKSHLVSYELEKNIITEKIQEKEITFRISLNASSEGFPNVDLGIKEVSVPLKTMKEAIGIELIPKLFQIGRPLQPSEPGLFQGRSDIMNKIHTSFYGGIQRERYFLDGIRRVGKTSILNFLPPHLPKNIIPVLINLDYEATSGLRGPINSAVVLRDFCKMIQKSVYSSQKIEVKIPEDSAFRESPGDAFNVFLEILRVEVPDCVPFLMIDEFQVLLSAISESGSGNDQDTLVLDQMRGHLDEGHLYAVFTGSVRFDRLSRIIDHRIFGSLSRLRISFLSEESVAKVLRSGLEKWATIPAETIRKVYDLTGGYPWLVQSYGAEFVDLLNMEHRTLVVPEDVDFITREEILNKDELFKYWWPSEQLGVDEERFVEKLFREFPRNHKISPKEFFANIHSRDKAVFRRAFDKLRAFEVLDSTQTNLLKFSGELLRMWLEQHIQEDGHLRVNKATTSQTVDRGKFGIFIDHENFIKSLERISEARGIKVPSDRLPWFNNILDHLLMELERRIGPLSIKVTVAFWNRPEESRLLSAYFSKGFTPAQPEEVKVENAVDFKVSDEVRRAMEQAMREGTRLGKAIIVTGDGDLTHAARAILNDGVSVQIWASSKSISDKYIGIVGQENIVMLEDVSGL